ncbi:MAG: hypothetical protein A3G41_07885 [Elusimicrobia bacterium RIFCSPLOWO2_12_FULL_59_9]|nr:MAG: hypothetical protein A3G41_07885 [Elusimicrobia bacterium RIFCSPLOWO2_12_FULL_59_9]
MLKNIEVFYFPETVKDAVRLLNRHAPHAAVIAGGTLITKSPNLSTRVLVDIRGIDMDYVKVQAGRLRIGARTSFQSLADSKLLQKWAGGALSRAAAAVTTHLIRNAGTIGGDVARALPYNDMPPVLMALDAEAVIVDGKKTRTLPVEEMVRGHMWRIVGRRALLTEFRLPSETRKRACAIARFARSASDWEAMVHAVASMEKSRGICRNARIVLGAVTRHAQRFPQAEAVLEGKPYSESLAAEAAQAVFDGLTPVSRASAEYRREVASVLVRRAIREVWNENETQQ